MLVKKMNQHSLIRYPVENLKKGFWKLEFVKSHPQWEEIRMVANNLLNKMGEKRRNYDSGFTAIVVAD